jgi:hypothetical protein
MAIRRLPERAKEKAAAGPTSRFVPDATMFRIA